MWRYGTSLFWMARWQGWVRSIGIGLAVWGFLTAHERLGLLVLLLVLAPSFYFLGAPAWWAHRHHQRAIWSTPVPTSWMQRQLPTPVPLGPVVWEVHAQDGRRWAAWTPHEAARQYRQTYAAELIQLIDIRPDTVGLVSSGFNRLTPAEATAIRQAGGCIWDGPLWPRLLRRYPPWIMRATQKHMFGAVVSHKDRRDASTWVTWAVPARSGAAPRACRLEHRGG